MMRKVLPVVAIAAGLALAPLAGATGAEASGSGSCSVPCGYIYPLIIIEPEDPQDVRDLPEEGTIEVDATLTWTFDIANEGFTLNNPTEPIEVTFEFPRKPAWAGMEVEPSKFEVPITPQYIEPEGDDPTDPGAQYVYTRDITVRMEQKDQATLPPDQDVAKLLVFAKSSESGLYKPSYGIKEFTVDPEGATVADPEDGTVDADEVPAFEVPAQARSLGPVDIELRPQGTAEVFSPTPFEAAVTHDGEPVPAEVSLSLVGEDRDLLYATGPRDLRDGLLHANLTFPEPGTYRVVATASPGAGADVAWRTGSVAFPVDVPGTGADAVQLENQYSARYHEVVSEVHGEHGDPARQYEKHIPLPVYQGANGAHLLFELGTDNPAAEAPSGPANLNVELLSPDGAVVAKGSFDPPNPTLRMPVNALPGPGLYQVHVFGQGGNADALAGASYDVQASVTYDGAPVVRDVADGELGPPGEAAHGGLALETEHRHHAPWTPQDLSISITDASGEAPDEVEAALTVLTGEGRPVHATGWRAVGDGVLEETVTFPDVGAHVAAVHLRTPMGNGTQVQPTTLASTLHVGGHEEPTVTFPEALQVEASGEVPPGAAPSSPYRASHPVHVRAGADALEASLAAEAGPGDAFRLQVVDEGGEVVAEADGADASLDIDDVAAGWYDVVVEAESASGASYDLGVSVPYGEPVTVENPLFAGAAPDAGAASEDDAGNLTPLGPAAALAGLAAAALAARRR